VKNLQEQRELSGNARTFGIIAAFAAVFITVLVLFLVLMPDAGSVDDLTHQDAQAARSVLASFKSVSDDRRSGENWLAIAHAHASLKDAEKALSAYARASKLNAMDEAGTRYCIAQLADPLMRDIAIRVLTDFRQGTGVDALLREVLAHDAMVMRNNALRVLKKRGADTVDMQVNVAILDLLNGPSCAERRTGLKRLGDYASGPAKQRSLEAIREIEEHIGNELNSCMIVELEKIKDRIIDR